MFLVTVKGDMTRAQKWGGSYMWSGLKRKHKQGNRNIEEIENGNK